MELIDFDSFRKVLKEYHCLNFTILIENDYGEVINTETEYICSKCGWIGTVLEMVAGFDCNYDDSVYGDYECPKCGYWSFLIENWKEVSDDS